MTGTKKSLIASGISLAVSAALLIGSTFAWFTDSVTNKGNKIQAGNLKIGAYAYDLDKNGNKTFTIKDVNGGNAFTFEADPQDLRTETAPIINDTDWEPGKSSAKLLKVVNDGTLAAEIKLDFKTSGELTNALWFDFVKVENGEVTGNFEKRPMSTLSAVAQALELPMINTGDTLQFILVYGMYETANNDYQGKDFTADVTILAKQYTYEKDGFGSSDYDTGATYSSAVKTAQEIIDAINGADTADIKVADNAEITMESAISIGADKKITLDLGDNSILTTNGSYGINVAAGGSLSLSGTGTIDGDDSLVPLANFGTLLIEGNITVTKTNSMLTEGTLSNGKTGILNISGGTFDGGNKVAVKNAGGQAYISGGTFKGEMCAFFTSGNGVTEISGGQFYGNIYSTNGAGQQSSTTITGGEFINGTLESGSSSEIIVKGGTFTGYSESNIGEFLADGYTIVSDGNVFTVIEE